MAACGATVKTRRWREFLLGDVQRGTLVAAAASGFRGNECEQALPDPCPGRSEVPRSFPPDHRLSGSRCGTQGCFQRPPECLGRVTFLVGQRRAEKGPDVFGNLCTRNMSVRLVSNGCSISSSPFRGTTHGGCSPCVP